MTDKCRKVKAKILSYLSENYIKYQYSTKGLESINFSDLIEIIRTIPILRLVYSNKLRKDNKSFDVFNDYMKNNKDKKINNSSKNYLQEN